MIFWRCCKAITVLWNRYQKLANYGVAINNLFCQVYHLLLDTLTLEAPLGHAHTIVCAIFAHLVAASKIIEDLDLSVKPREAKTCTLDKIGSEFDLAPVSEVVDGGYYPRCGTQQHTLANVAIFHSKIWSMTMCTWLGTPPRRIFCAMRLMIHALLVPIWLQTTYAADQPTDLHHLCIDKWVYFGHFGGCGPFSDNGNWYCCERHHCHPYLCLMSNFCVRWKLVSWLLSLFVILLR